jgi:hypothetical protein
LLALQNALERKARELGAALVVWKDMPPGISQGLDWLVKHRRLHRAVSLPGTLVKFSSPRKNDYFGQLKASRRSALKKKLKLSDSEAGLSARILQNPAPEVLDEIFGLFRQTYRKSKMKFEELNRTWFERIAEMPWTYEPLAKLQQSERRAAFLALGGRRFGRQVCDAGGARRFLAQLSRGLTSIELGSRRAVHVTSRISCSTVSVRMPNMRWQSTLA